MLLWDLFGKFPGTDYESFNYEWIIGKLKELKDSVAAALASEQAAAESEDSAHASMLAATVQATKAKTYAEHSATSAQESADSAESIAGVVDQVNSNTSRIGSLIAHAGDGTVPSELTDIRIGYDGTTYTTAGDAVRDQISDLHVDIAPLYGDKQLGLVRGQYWPVTGEHAGQPWNYSGWARTDRIACTPGETLKITLTGEQSIYNPWFRTDTDGDTNGYFTVSPGENIVTVPSGIHYFALSNTITSMENTVLNSIVNASEVNAIKNTADAAYAATSAIPKWCVYVDPVNGNDTNDGSIDHPLATLQRAIAFNTLEIKAKPGEYTGIYILDRETPLTIRPYGTPTYDITVPERPKIKIVTANQYGEGVSILRCGEIKLVDIQVDDTTYDCFKITYTDFVELVRCIAAGNSTANSCGFKLENVDARFHKCVAHDVTLDGFNMHGYGHTEFFDCDAYNCGDDGISHHDGCTGYISGGSYHHNGKGGIASPYSGAKIDIDAAYICDNVYGIYSMSPSTAPVTEANISNCVIKNNDTLDISVDYMNGNIWNTIYDTKYIGPHANVNEY